MCIYYDILSFWPVWQLLLCPRQVTCRRVFLGKPLYLIYHANHLLGSLCQKHWIWYADTYCWSVCLSVDVCVYCPDHKLGILAWPDIGEHLEYIALFYFDSVWRHVGSIEHFKKCKMATTIAAKIRFTKKWSILFSYM